MKWASKCRQKNFLKFMYLFGLISIFQRNRTTRNGSHMVDMFIFPCHSRFSWKPSLAIREGQLSCPGKEGVRKNRKSRHILLFSIKFYPETRGKGDENPNLCRTSFFDAHLRGFFKSDVTFLSKPTKLHWNSNSWKNYRVFLYSFQLVEI